jgi:nucleotide-binding universal stress UspA family protein
MYKRVLVPLDGSAVGEAALAHVANLVKGTNATVTLLTVAPTPERMQKVKVVAGDVQGAAGQFDNFALQEMHYFDEGETEQQATSRVKEDADSYLAKAAQPLREGGVSVAHDVLIGDDPADAIADYATEGDFDVIAMATHGREGISRLISGSIAEKVLHRAGIPVLLVQPPGY